MSVRRASRFIPARIIAWNRGSDDSGGSLKSAPHVFLSYLRFLTMTDRNYSAFQQKVIKRYYDNKDQIDEQRLSELVTNLYLAPPRKQAKMWESAEELMTRMKLPASRIAHVMETKDAAVLAKVVEELQKGVIKRG
ncbi:MAG: hypothetical protein WKF77_18950 [Planctomycetaceae bacterium]